MPLVGRMSGVPSSANTQKPQVVQGSTGLQGRMANMGGPYVGLGRMAPAEEQPQEAVPTNPLSYLGGMIKHIGTGAVDIVKGLGTLFIGAPAHDITQGIANIVPGEQAIEQEPSQLATIARTALPGAWVPGPDIGGKYGAIVSDIAQRYGGASNIARGLYENPLSYVMDALVVADGVGLIAKTGRVGALAKLPELVGDETASRILGPALKYNEGTTGIPTLARYGERPFQSLERGAAAGVMEDALKVSKNPLVRYVQNRLYNGLLSFSPEQALNAGLDETMRGAQAIKAAEEATKAFEDLSPAQQAVAPTRILRPKVGQFLAQHENSRILGAFRVNMRDLSKEAIDELRPLMPANGTDVNGEVRAIDYEKATRIDQGIETPGVLPKLDNIDFEDPGTPIKTPMEAIPYADQMPFDPNAAKYIADNYTYGKSPVGQTSIVAPETPYTRAGGGNALSGNPGTNSFKIAVETLDDAPRAAQEALRGAGYTDDIFHVNTLADEANPYHILSYYGKNPETGTYMHVTVGTPGMLYAQEAASGTFGRIAEMTAQAKRVLEDIIKSPDDTLRTKLAGEFVRLKEELQYAREYLKEEIFAGTRARFWESKGEYLEPEVAAALDTRPWRAKHFTEPWFEQAPGEASYSRMMNEKYVPLRTIQMSQKLGHWAKDFNRILTTGQSAISKAGKVTADHYTYLNLVKYLEKQGVSNTLIESILGKSPWLNDAGKRIPGEAAIRIANRARDVMWDVWVKEGGGGKSAFQEFSARAMQMAAKDPNLPGIVPSYMPYLPKLPSQHAMASPPVALSERAPGFFTEERTGRLFSEGAAEMDMSKALPRAARIIYMHDSMNQYFRQIDRAFGRDATVAEMNAARVDSHYAGEVFYNPHDVTTKIDARGRLASKVTMDVPDAGTVLQALTDNIEHWAGEVFQESLNDGTIGTIRAIPKHIADEMSREMRHQFGNNVKLFWDTPMKVWKASVLSLSPRWIVNNLFGNAIFVGLENPGAFRSVLSQLDRRNRAFAESLLGYDPIRVVESGFYQEVNRGQSALTTAELTGTKGEAVKRAIMGDKELETGPLSPLAKMNYPSRGLQRWSRGVRTMNSYVEESFRRGIFIDELTRTNLLKFEKGLKSNLAVFEEANKGGWTKRLVEDAYARTDRVIGNFMRYSPFEQGIIRRFLMPFYGFYRHMTNVLVKLPIEHPLKASLFQKIGEMQNVMEVNMPEYLKGQQAINVSGLLGDDVFLRLKNMNPLSGITEAYGPINAINPGLKILMERGLGINTFTGEPFKIEDLGLSGEMVQTHDGQFWQVIRDGDGNVIDVVRSGRPLPSLTEHVGSQFGLTALLPSFNLYKRSYEQQIASWVGLPLTRPKNGTAGALAYDQEVHDEAMSAALGGASQDFGSFDNTIENSFGSF